MTVEPFGEEGQCAAARSFTDSPDQGSKAGVVAAVMSVSSWIAITIFKPFILQTMAEDIMGPWSVSSFSKYSFVQILDHL